MALQWLKRAVVCTSVLLVLSGLVSSKKSSDRHCSEYGVLNESWRSVQVEERNAPRRCDDGDGFARWYRFMGEAGTAMPTEPPPSSHRCGSDAPVWVNGTNPTYEDGVVERQACARFSGNVCSWSWTIHVKRCPEGFLIYKLKPVEACRLTYCGLGVQKVAVDDVARPASNEDDDGSGALDVHKEVPIAKVHSACRDYRILNEPQRSIHNQVDPNAAAIDLICDQRSKVENRLWYRFEGEGGGMIPTERPLTANRCGTHAPVWMQGRHPTVEEGAVTRTVCAFWDRNDCNWSWKIKVLSCPGGYFVYKLRKPTECLLAYCTTDGSPQRTTPPPTPVRSEDFLSDEEDEVSGSGDDKVVRKNLALHKPTRQSSLWDAGYSGNAVDGVRSTDWYSGSCTHTKASLRHNVWKVGTTDPWWYVDLGSSYPIGKIVIVNRRARNPVVTARISPFDIHVGSSEIVAANPKCGHGGRVFPPGEDEMGVSCGGIQGRYVGIRLPGENRILTLCEVEVYAEVNPQTTLSPVPTEPVSPDDADDVGSGASSDSVHPRCLKHKVVYSGWRQLRNNESHHMCDKSKVSGIKDGRWHRFLDARDASMVIPTERPLSTHRCGTHAPVWMKGRHPTVEEGAVTRTACAFWDEDECKWSWEIDVMACPGGYFVYKLPIPPVCQLAYCTTYGNPQTTTDDSLSDDEDDVGSGEPYDEVTPQTTMPSTTTVGCVTQALGRGAATSGRPTARSAISQATTTVPVPTDAPPSDDEDDAASVTPCPSHYVLDEPWRSVNAQSEDMCDKRSSLKHDQWYRFVGAGGTMMPTKRPLETKRCGTHAPVWMKGEHPTSIQGAVRRTACAFWEGKECFWSWTIHVMACPAGYYIYKLPKPTICHAAYCTTVPLDEDAEGSGESEGSGDMTYTRRGDTQYKIYTESKTYDAAKKTCAADGGHLAVIKTEAVYNFLLGMIRDADVNKDYWIGLNDKAVENSWTWADGEPLNDGGFTKWAPGEPNNAEGIQDCGQLWAAKDFRWDDDRCYNAKYFICQIGPGEAYDEEDIIFVEEPEEEPLPTQEAGNDCPENNIVVLPSGKYYYSSDDAMTYEDAQTECRRKGGIVAVPRNEEEQRNVVMLKNCVSRDNQFWLGVRWSPEGWVDGRGAALGSFSTWAPGEPNDRYNGYRCAHIVYGNKEGDRRNNWADAYCNSLYNFVCELEDQEAIGPNVKAASCSEVKSSFPAGKDGEYTLHPFSTCEDVSLRVYCHNMASEQPEEFLTLPSGPDNNFANIFADRLRVNYGGRCNGPLQDPYTRSAGTTKFSKIRIKFENSKVKVIRDDYTFASTDGYNNVAYGEAGDCYSWKQGCAKGTFKLNLTGTDLSLAPDVHWVMEKRYPEYISINDMFISEDRTVASARCGGWCGHCWPVEKTLILSHPQCDGNSQKSKTKGCPIPGYIPLNGACYKKFAEPKTYAEARERCAADGGLIAMPRDRATNRFITNLHPGFMSWIGLTNINSEGQWVFEDGQTLESSDYSNWFHTEPNDAGGNEDCAQVRTRGFWNDVRCSTTIGFTCQIGHGKSVKDFYQGCYKDGERRRLPHAFRQRADMTADVCVQHCRQKGYTYAGTQYYKECWCGSELPTRGPREDSECATPCGGNQKEMCGGEWRLSVYKAMPVADITTVSPEEHECQISDGALYRGNVAVTKSGRTCQRWDQQTPHEHSRTAANYPSSGLEENFCRNPDGTSGVWCYTTDPNKRWELCDVAVCATVDCNTEPRQLEGNKITVVCPDGCLETGGVVWGFVIYTDDSSLCRAAIHAGRIPATGGEVTLYKLPGQDSYLAAEQHGITTRESGDWGGSFAFSLPPVVPEVEERADTVDCHTESRDRDGDIYTVICPAGCASGATVWGTVIYTDDSSICRAAIHDGRITNSGGEITVYKIQGQDSYLGSEQNGIQTVRYSSWGGSFAFTRDPQMPQQDEPEEPDQATIDCHTEARQLDGQNVSVTCPAGCLAGTSTIWGLVVYTDDSSICGAAIHDGRLTDAGGEVTLYKLPGLDSYLGVEQNGIQTRSYGRWEGAFAFTPKPIVPLQEPAKETVTCHTQSRDIPDVNTGESYTVNCPAGCAEMGGTVWGKGIYTDDSSICRAAIHDGRIPASGGEVTGYKIPGQASYQGSDQNGVQTLGYGSWSGSFAFTNITEAYVTTAIPQTPGPTPAPASRSKPKVTTEGKVTVLKSTNVTLKCTLRSRLRNTHHRVNWYRVGENGTQGAPLLTYIDRHAFYNKRRSAELGLVDRLEAVDDHASLRILRVKGEDSGTYRCEVMLVSQQLSYADVNLTILECSTDKKKDQTIVNEFDAIATEAGRSVDNDDYQGQGQGIVIISDTGSVFTVALFTGGIFFILFVVIFAVVLFVWRKRK
ncbi:uncharacterized protein LOC144926973 isoform X2 [Branchiostoma floridae x Branchiostoma belcheri]